MDLRTTTHCHECRADMRDMRDVRNRRQVNEAGTHAQCNACYTRRLKVRMATRGITKCAQCGKAKKPTTWRFCSTRCQRVNSKVREGAQQIHIYDGTDEILTLVELRDRCATHWERAEITEKIEALRNKEPQVEA